MKKGIILIGLVALLTTLAMASVHQSRAFVATAFDLNAGVTKVNGTDFTSVEINIQSPSLPPVGLLVATFTRAAGSALTVDFYFQVSYDGSTWATYKSTVSIETQEAVVSGTTVRLATPVYLYGIHSIRLWKVVNNDTANNLTAVNATLSL